MFSLLEVGMRKGTALGLALLLGVAVVDRTDPRVRADEVASPPGQGRAAVGAAPREVTGSVFEDANGNGRRDPGEPGLAGAAVSDQHEVTITDAQGSYRLLARAEADVVFVSLPDGFRPVGETWRPLSPGAATERHDLPLRRLPPRSEFTFVHASDTHVSAANLPRMQRLREKVAGLRPDFVLITGDLVRDALRVPEAEARSYYDLFVEERARFDVPVFAVPGNHENFGIERHLSLVSPQHPLYGKRMYRRYLGPNYYSFTWGGVRFLGLDTVDVDDLWYYGHLDADQLAWLERDLARAAPGMPLVTFNHIPLASAMDALSGYRDEPPAPSTIRVGNRTLYRHVVSNTGELLARLRGHRLELALGGHMHARESLSFLAGGRLVRFHQAGAILGPSEAAGLEMTSGFTVYRVKDGVVDDGTFVPL
jgi:predicted MPP superfamily phosphohydrolase